MTGDDLFRSKTLLLGGGIACAVAAGAAFLYYRSRRQAFVEVGKVSGIFIHPVKSCRPMAIAQADCINQGIRFKNLMDRSWLLIDNEDRFVTMRQQPKMAIIQTSLSRDDQSLLLDAPNMSTLELPILQTQGEIVKTKVWGQPIEGRDCGKEASEWFSHYLEKTGYRLLHFDPSALEPRKVIGQPLYKNLAKDKDEAVFQDATPFMLLSESSLVDLNGKLDKKLQMNSFRPNIVVTGCAPYEEDEWKTVIIGKEVKFRSISKCGRCIATKVDPESGIMDKEEPLKTLKTFRLCDPSEKYLYKSSPLFGVNLAVDVCGTISVGDTVYASRN